MPTGVYIRTKEHKKILSEAQKGRIAWNKGLTKETNKSIRKMADAKRGQILSEEVKAKISRALKGKVVLEETRKKLSELLKGKNNPMYGKHHSEKTRKKMSKAQLENPTKYWLGKKFTKEMKKKISNTNKGKFVSEETKKRLSESHKGKKYSEETKRKMSEVRLEKWQNLKYQKKMHIAQHLKPNNLEKFFNQLTPEYIRYVGDFSLWIKTKDGTRNPDFIIEGQKKIIEIFGDFWHNGENPKYKIKEYEIVGWECKIFWEKEIYNNTKKILEETLEFAKN